MEPDGFVTLNLKYLMKPKKIIKKPVKAKTKSKPTKRNRESRPKKEVEDDEPEIFFDEVDDDSFVGDDETQYFFDDVYFDDTKGGW